MQSSMASSPPGGRRGEADEAQEIRAGVDRARPAPSTHALRAERGPALLAARSTRRSLSLAPGQRSLRGRCHRGPRRRHRGGDPTMSEPDTPLTIAEIDAAHPPAGESAGEWGGIRGGNARLTPPLAGGGWCL